MTVDELVENGDFTGALSEIAADLAGAKPDPANLLLAFNLEVRLQRFDAAEASIRRLIQQAPELSPAMTGFMRLARAERAATERMTNPDSAGKRGGIGMPPPHGLCYVKAAVHHAMRDYATAAAALAEAAPITPASAGTLTWKNGRTGRFSNLSDSDELTGPILPCYEGDTVLDVTYYELKSIAFGAPRTSFDVMWIPAELVPVSGKPFNARIPAFHVGTGVANMDMVRSGRMTMWDRSCGYAIASGQRDFQMFGPDGGKSLVGILQVQRIDFDAPVRIVAPEKPKGFWKKLLG